MLPLNPAQSVELPKRTRREMKTLSPDEVTSFLKAAKEDAHGLIFAFALATGMRPEEYLALQWKDIDFQKGTATVQRTLCWRRQKGGGWYFGEPKTAQSRRTVPLLATIARELSRHKMRQTEARLKLGAKYQASIWSSPPPQAGHCTRRILRTGISRRYERKRSCPTITPYTLRHTCATLLLLADENPKVVCERLGHSSIVMTLDTYSHVLPSMQQAATEKREKCSSVSLAHYRHTKLKTGSRSAARNSLITFGWEAGIRTPIGGSRVRSLTVRRPPSGKLNL
jgi:integrase